MEANAASHFLRDGFVLLAAALFFVLLFRRLGLGATLGYLVAGALVGPHGLRLIGNAEDMGGIGELGICGVAAAIANAIYNATGTRVREYPITLDKLIDRLPPPVAA